MAWSSNSASDFTRRLEVAFTYPVCLNSSRLSIYKLNFTDSLPHRSCGKFPSREPSSNSFAADTAATTTDVECRIVVLTRRCGSPMEPSRPRL